MMDRQKMTDGLVKYQRARATIVPGSQGDHWRLASYLDAVDAAYGGPDGFYRHFKEAIESPSATPNMKIRAASLMLRALSDQARSSREMEKLIASLSQMRDEQLQEIVDECEKKAEEIEKSVLEEMKIEE